MACLQDCTGRLEQPCWPLTLGPLTETRWIFLGLPRLREDQRINLTLLPLKVMNGSPFKPGPSGPFIHCCAFKKRRMYWVPFNCLPAEVQRSGYQPGVVHLFSQIKACVHSTYVHMDSFLYSGHQSTRPGTKAWKRDGVIRCRAASTHLCLQFRTLIRFAGEGSLCDIFLKQKCLWFPPSQNTWCFPKDPELGHVLIWEKFHYKNKYVLKHFCWNCENQCSYLKEKVLWVWNRLMPWPVAL